MKGCDTSRRRSLCFEYGSPSRRSSCSAICKHRKHNGIYSQMDRSRVLNFYKQRNVKQNRLGSRNVLRGDESNGFWPIYMICSLRNGLSPYPEWRRSLVSSYFALKQSPKGRIYSDTRGLSYKAANPGSPVANAISTSKLSIWRKATGCISPGACGDFLCLSESHA